MNDWHKELWIDFRTNLFTTFEPSIDLLGQLWIDFRTNLFTTDISLKSSLTSCGLISEQTFLQHDILGYEEDGVVD